MAIIKAFSLYLVALVASLATAGPVLRSLQDLKNFTAISTTPIAQPTKIWHPRFPTSTTPLAPSLLPSTESIVVRQIGGDSVNSGLQAINDALTAIDTQQNSAQTAAELAAAAQKKANDEALGLIKLARRQSSTDTEPNITSNGVTSSSSDGLPAGPSDEQPSSPSVGQPIIPLPLPLPLPLPPPLPPTGGQPTDDNPPITPPGADQPKDDNPPQPIGPLRPQLPPVGDPPTDDNPPQPIGPLRPQLPPVGDPPISPPDSSI